MAFDILGIDDRRWPELVAQARADIFYEPSFCRFATEGTPHRPVMLVFQDCLGTVFDVSVEKSISSLPFFSDVAHRFAYPPIDLASPDYNSPILIADSSSSCELLRRYRLAVDEYCRAARVVTEFVRFHPLSESRGLCSEFMAVHPGAEIIYADLREGYDNAFRQYRKGHKSTVKKAAREGASVRFCSTQDVVAMHRLHSLYIEAMRRNEAKSVYHHPLEHLEHLFHSLGDRVLLMESVMDQEVASSNAFLLGRRHVWFKYSGLDERYRATGAHTYMLDRAIHWACEAGYELFMLGGGMDVGDSSSTSALYRSKRGFSHSGAITYHFKKVHDQKTLEILSQAKTEYDARMGRETKLQYFPSYWLS